MKKQILVGVMLLSGAAIQSIQTPTKRTTASDSNATDYQYPTGTTQGNLTQISTPYNDGKTYTLVTKPYQRQIITVGLPGGYELEKEYLYLSARKNSNVPRQYYIIVDGKKAIIEQSPNGWVLSKIYDENINEFTKLPPVD